MRRLFALGMVMSFQLFAACGSSDSGSGGGAASDCASATRVLCQKFDSCSHFVVLANWGSVDKCVQRNTADCKAEAASPGAGLTEAQAAKCANAANALSCDQIFKGVEIPECDVGGSRDDGQSCGYDSQCKSANCSITTDFCGVCAPRSAAGGSCSSDGDCEAALICAGGVCATAVPDGGACSNSNQCQAMSTCKNNVCAGPSPAGADCQSSGDCDILKGVLCDPTTNKCAAATLAQPGETCGIVNGQIIICASGGRCQSSGSSTSGSCAAGLADGASCSPATGPDCTDPARCINGTCTLKTATSCG